MKKIEFVFQESPEAGKLYEITEGVYWFPMPLPMMGPDYVNCYILDDGQEIALVDTGANIGDCKNIWENTLKKNFPKKKISNVYVTHHHPDHIGLAGWLCEKYNTEMICSRTAYLMAKMLSLDVHEKVSASTELFWKQAGMSQQMLEEKLRARPFNFGDGVSPLDKGFIRISENEIIRAAQRNRRVSDYAKCWASKEAFSKALGTGIRDGLFMKDISLERDRLGKPQIYLNSRSRERVDKIFYKSPGFDIHISITDDFPWVQASVIICENTKVNNYSLP